MFISKRIFLALAATTARAGRGEIPMIRYRLSGIRQAALLTSAAISLATFWQSEAFAQLQEGEAYISCFPGVANQGQPTAKIDLTQPAGGIVDMRNPAIPPTTTNWSAPKRKPVTARQVGLIFGIAIDRASPPNVPPNVYVANSAAFGMHIVDSNGNTIATGAPGARWMDGQFGALSVSALKPQGEPAIYIINSTTGTPTRFGTLTNDGPGFGDIAFNRYTTPQNFYVSDLSNGKIYRLDSTGAVMNPSGFNPCPSCAPDSSGTVNIQGGTFTSNVLSAAGATAAWGVTQNSRLVWAVGVHQRTTDATPRLFYSVGQGSSAKIFSVSLDAVGAIGSDIVDENVNLSGIAANNYISDIAFTNTDKMLVAERGGLHGTVATSIFPGADLGLG